MLHNFISIIIFIFKKEAMKLRNQAPNQAPIRDRVTIKRKVGYSTTDDDIPMPVAKQMQRMSMDDAN
jgi:hypothetical protein